jgi:hypothetical protein
MNVRENQDWIELHQDIGLKISTDEEEQQQPRRKAQRRSPVSSKRGEQAHINWVSSRLWNINPRDVTLTYGDDTSIEIMTNEGIEEFREACLDDE